MNRIINKINKLSLPAVILVASIILGSFYFASQINKQKSIEKQQGIKLQENRRIEETETEQEHKKYVAKRKLECYDIYEREREEYNNVSDFGYVENYNADNTPDYRDDTCEIIYKKDETGKYFRKYR